MKSIELTGSINLATLRKEAAGFLAPLDPDSFSNIGELYNEIRSRGTLTFRNAVVTLPTDDDLVQIVAHKVTFIKTDFFIKSTSSRIICNEYSQLRSRIQSFDPEDQRASDGDDGEKPGTEGKDGSDGLSAGQWQVFVTDVISTGAPGEILLSLSGQHAGDGGNGSKGKKGARGSRGRGCANGIPPDCRSGCGNGGRGRRGGTGGDGGDGGNGGNGSISEFWLHGETEPRPNLFSFLAPGGFGGHKGSGAQGGDGGDGGRAGNSGCSQCDGRCYPGARGPAGPSGADGEIGQKGSAGYLKRAAFKPNYLKSVLRGRSPLNSQPISMDNGLAARFSE